MKKISFFLLIFACNTCNTTFPFGIWGKKEKTNLSADQKKLKKQISKYIKDGGSVNTLLDGVSVSLLHLAAGNGLTDVVEELIAHNADINQSANDDGRHALHFAVLSRHSDTATALLKHGTPVDVQDVNNKTALMLAARSGQKDMVEVCLAHGANVERQDSDGSTALHKAASSNFSKIVATLIHHKAPLDTKMQNGLTALHLATAHGHREVINLLLASRASVTATTIDDATALHIAAGKSDIDIMQTLLEHGAPIEALTAEGISALYIAASREKTGTAATHLLEYGADPAQLAKTDDESEKQANTKLLETVMVRHQTQPEGTIKIYRRSTHGAIAQHITINDIVLIIQHYLYGKDNFEQAVIANQENLQARIQANLQSSLLAVPSDTPIAATQLAVTTLPTPSSPSTSLDDEKKMANGKKAPLPKKEESPCRQM